MNYVNLPDARAAYEIAWRDSMADAGADIKERADALYRELTDGGTDPDMARREVDDHVDDWRRDARDEADQAARDAEREWHEFNRA